MVKPADLARVGHVARPDNNTPVVKAGGFLRSGGLACLARKNREEEEWKSV